MRKTRGFRLGRKLVKVFNRFIHRRKKPRTTTYRRLSPPSVTTGPISKLRKWGRSLKHGAKGLCSLKRNSGYIRVEQDPVDTNPVMSVPKGHLAVYVGEKEDDTCRFFVPVIYFNHPLFGQLLNEAEKVYGFDHSGGIQIPCGVSEFENVRMQIAAAGGGNRRRRQSWRNSYW